MAIDEDLTSGSATRHYAYRVTHENTKYTLKGYKLELTCNPKNPEALDDLSAVYQQYFFLKSTSSFTPHVLKPLLLDTKLEIANKDSYLFIEILFEGGTTLDSFKPPNIEAVYNLMAQSVRGLLFLHNISITDLRPFNMILSNNVLKFDEAARIEGNASKYGLEYAAPEVLRTGGALDGLRYRYVVDVYYWAISFWSLLLKMAGSGLESHWKEYRLRSKKHADLVNRLRNELKAVKALNDTEVKMKTFIEKVLLNALEYNPKDRPSMRAIAGELKKFERENSIRTQCNDCNLSKSLAINKALIKLSAGIKLDKEEKVRVCSSCSEYTNVSIELVCGHVICKECLREYVLRSFLKKWLIVQLL
eukprot:TRINITY_DN12099_c0_g4_i5.p1 TRINITY_DN12099_c0_g4~~TRINITY_DN12099_c0_g4_i5.p1  ORF type:complete len:362 (-),score=45.40 TRINITY_DN12099_c0_g4_i5:341-1426(-)